MAYSSNPLRNEAEEFIRAEIGRVGPDGLDKSSIVRRYVDRGASKTRVHEWIKALVQDAKNPPPDPLEAEVAQVEAMIAAADRAKVLNALPSKPEIRKLQQEVASIERTNRQAHESRVPVSVCPPAADLRTTPALLTMDQAGSSPAAPSEAGVGTVMAKLDRAMQAVEHCIAYSYGQNGQVRNPRMALAAADALRKCLETALRLHETVDNVQAVQQFMAEIMAELRDVAPDVASAVVERLRGVTGRWAK